MTKYTAINSSDGFSFGTYQSEPAANCKGAVVVLQEIFGVNLHIRDVVDGYASSGYFAIAPQIFDRVERSIELGYGEEGMSRGVELAFQQLEMSQTLADIQATIEYASSFGKVAIVGYCFGGLLSWLSACQLEGVSAASCYYGGGLALQKDLIASCSVIMHFGDRDAHIPLSDVDSIRDAQPKADIYVYEADHGFNCNVRESYDELSANLALQRTLAFFDKHLS